MILKLKTLLHNIIDEAELEKQSSISDNKLNKKVLTTFIIVPFCLTMIHYLGNYTFLRNILSTIGADGITKWMDPMILDSFGSNFGSLCYWVFILFLFYFIIPALTIKYVFMEKLSDYGLKVKDAFKDYYLYIIMLMFMIPLVAYFSTTASFQDRYPFLKINESNLLFPQDQIPHLWEWELIYCAQFFALEFFFRGFVLFGLKPKLGFYSVFVMTIPYCMIHFGKPMPETLAAIFAGIVLGCLSLKNRSIWLGFLIHCSVGMGMDMASLWQKGLLHL